MNRNEIWKEYAPVFDILGDAEISQKTSDARESLSSDDWLDAIKWIEAVEAWELAGRPRTRKDTN